MKIISKLKKLIKPRKENEQPIKSLLILLNSSGGNGNIPASIIVEEKYIENGNYFLAVECANEKGIFRVRKDIYEKYGVGGIVQFFDLSITDIPDNNYNEVTSRYGKKMSFSLEKEKTRQ